jgi:short chain dehydrogenase
VIVQVVADRQVGGHGDAVLAQVTGRAVLDLLDPGGGGQGLDERLRGGGEVPLPGHLDRASGPAQRGRAVFPVLEALEAGQHVGVAPARAARGGPVVVVLPVPADEDHAVDRAGPAQHPAPGLRDPAAERAGLRGGVVPPVQSLLQRGHVPEAAKGRLDGKVALIAGGARGMGKSHVRHFVAEGAQVVFGDVLDERGAFVAAGVGERSCRYLHHDVTSEDD